MHEEVMYQDESNRISEMISHLEGIISAIDKYIELTKHCLSRIEEDDLQKFAIR